MIQVVMSYGGCEWLQMEVLSAGESLYGNQAFIFTMSKIYIQMNPKAFK